MNSIVAKERIIALRKKRSAQDLRFKYYGFIAMCLALAVLVFLLSVSYTHLTLPTKRIV